MTTPPPSRTSGYGDADEARRILLHLRDTYGLSIRELSSHSGVSTSVIEHLLGRRRWYVQAKTLARLRLLAAQPVPTGRRPPVPLGPVREQVRMMAAMGWPIEWQAHQCGLRSGTFQWAARARLYGTVPAELADQVAALFDSYAYRLGPSDMARREARRRGWHTAYALDDDGHLIPGAVLRGRPPSRRRWLTGAERAEVVELWGVYGASRTTLEYLTARYGVSERTIYRVLARAERAERERARESLARFDEDMARWRGRCAAEA
jgi:hypothetical protein